MKNILIIGCGLLGSSLLRCISKKKIAKKIFIYEKSKSNIRKIKIQAHYNWSKKKAASVEAAFSILIRFDYFNIFMNQMYCIRDLINLFMLLLP